MTFTRASDITLEIPRAAIETIFDECDRYNADETGGRILGSYKYTGGQLGIAVSGIIEPGPNAQRTQTFFKQDGAYQEKVFREIEERVPTIEHLGNWHTHHVNGLKHLSGGDIQTYRRTVEHAKHNTDFFYALLVTEKLPDKKGLQRYVFKNYVMRRGDENVYEIPASAVVVVDAPLVWPTSEPIMPAHKIAPLRESTANADLAYDHDVISQFYPKVKTLRSRELGIYWRGRITQPDGSQQEVVVVRDTDAGAVCSVTLRNPFDRLDPVNKALGKHTFPSGRAALIATERACNAQLVTATSHKKKRRRLWMF